MHMIKTFKTLEFLFFGIPSDLDQLKWSGSSICIL